MVSTLIANFSGVGDVNSSAAYSLSAYPPLTHNFQFEPGAEVSPSQQPVKSQRLITTGDALNGQRATFMPQ